MPRAGRGLLRIEKKEEWKARSLVVEIGTWGFACQSLKKAYESLGLTRVRRRVIRNSVEPAKKIKKF